MIYIKITSPG